MKALRLVIPALLLSGCSAFSTVVPTDKAASIPPARLMNVALTQPAANTGSIIIKRDLDAIVLCPFRLNENGRQFAVIEAGEKVQIYLPPGRHLIGVKSTFMCDTGVEAEVMVRAGETQTYRVGMGSANQFQLHPTAF